MNAVKMTPKKYYKLIFIFYCCPLQVQIEDTVLRERSRRIESRICEYVLYFKPKIDNRKCGPDCLFSSTNGKNLQTRLAARTAAGLHKSQF